MIDFVKKAKLNELENKIPSFSNLVNKTDYKTKVREIKNKLTNHNHDKNIDTQEFNKLAADVFNARLIAQAKLITKTKVDDKLSSLNKKITLNKTKHLLIENGLNKLKTFDSSYFIGKNYFKEDGTQNYLVFQPLNKYFKLITNTFSILSWQPKELSAENIDPPSTSVSPSINYVGNKIRVKLSGICLKQSNKLTYAHKK